MADTKISALTAATTLAGTEALAGVQSAASVKITADQLKTWASNAPTLVTPTLGVAAGTSLALGGATIGSDALGVTGTASISGKITAASGSITIGAPGNGGLSLGNDLQTIKFGGASDLILGRNAAASLRLGFADAAAPVAQTLGVQSVVTGTSNTAGADFTIAGSKGTGTGAGGSIVFQVAPAGSTGSTPNALAAAYTINSAKQLVSNAAASWTVPSLTIAGSLTTGLSIFGGLNLITSGTSYVNLNSNNVVLAPTISLAWSPTSDNTAGAGDTFIIRGSAAATLQLGKADAASPVAQTLGVQSVVTGTSNTAGTDFTIAGSKGTGTGVGGSIVFQTAPAGSTGTAVNALATAVTITSAKFLIVGSPGSFANNGILASGMTLGTNGSTSNLAGEQLITYASNAKVGEWLFGTRLKFNSAHTVEWSSTSTVAGSTDLTLSRVGAGILKIVGTSGTGPGVVVTTATTVASLPSASTAGAGARCFVTDANATTFLSTVAAGGANKVPVVSDGTNWLIG